MPSTLSALVSEEFISGGLSHARKLFLGSCGALRPTWGSCWVGKWYTSSFDHDPWLAKLSELSALPFESYRPETLAAEEKK